jgi:hypothetical protein
MLYIAKLHPNQNACVTWLKKIAVHPPKCDVAFHQSSIIGLHTQHATALAIPTSTSLASPWKSTLCLWCETFKIREIEMEREYAARRCVEDARSCLDDWWLLLILLREKNTVS